MTEKTCPDCAEKVEKPSEDFDPSRFIRSVEWRFAKTMAHYNPHWYVVERDHRGAAFDAFVAFVRSGPIRRYKGGRYHCVTVDEWDYFLTHAGEDGWIVNRKPSDSAGWDPSPPPTRDPRELIHHDLRALAHHRRASRGTAGRARDLGEDPAFRRPVGGMTT